MGGGGTTLKGGFGVCATARVAATLRRERIKHLRISARNETAKPRFVQEFCSIAYAPEWLSLKSWKGTGRSSAGVASSALSLLLNGRYFRFGVRMARAHVTNDPPEAVGKHGPQCESHDER